MKTYVPKELMKEGWTEDHPKTKNNWNVERDVFTWLRFGDPIEDVIDQYNKWLNDDKSLFKKISILILYGSCHHNTWFGRCAECDKQHRECIHYLNDLLIKVQNHNSNNEFKQKEETQQKTKYDHITAKYLKILQLDGEITEIKIKKNYRKLASKYHPDKVASLGIEIKAVANKKMKEINEAREYLINYLKQ